MAHGWAEWTAYTNGPDTVLSYLGIWSDLDELLCLRFSSRKKQSKCFLYPSTISFELWTRRLDEACRQRLSGERRYYWEDLSCWEPLTRWVKAYKLLAGTKWLCIFNLIFLHPRFSFVVVKVGPASTCFRFSFVNNLPPQLNGDLCCDFCILSPGGLLICVECC